MEQVTVKITGQAITSRYGTLNTGDILRTDTEFARHLVEDCSAAEYDTKAVEIAPEPPVEAPEVAEKPAKKAK